MENYKKKYEEALERAKFLKENADGVGATDVSRCFEEIFPELKESEDDRIRKEIIYYLDREITLSNFGGDFATFRKWIAWLEKQGEQKPAEWSYNDDLIIEKIILALKAFVIYSCGPKPNKTIDGLIEYLKSFKERMKGE